MTAMLEKVVVATGNIAAVRQCKADGCVEYRRCPPCPTLSLNLLLKLFIMNTDMWDYRSTDASSRCTWRHRLYVNDTHVILQENYESGGRAGHFPPGTWKFSTGNGTQKAMVLQEGSKNSVVEKLLFDNSDWTCAVIKRTKIFFIGHQRRPFSENKYYLYTSTTDPNSAEKACRDKYIKYAGHKDMKHYYDDCEIIDENCHKK
ncbi:uncharacterized protein LOC142764995 [Rhipicephalus microplus]|uniref:uncharacterized protein LOC142764995 n=1 Tax=Rhipicephalus microplus TaxID=6941 RepID=UPI003F6B126C